MQPIMMSKCEICKKYCDDYFTISGVSKPKSHNIYENLSNTSANCCEWCYDKIMLRIAEIMITEETNG